MQAYMKSAMPYRGVSSPVIRRLCREAFTAHPLATVGQWRRVVLELWRQAAFREERYAAVLADRVASLSRVPDICVGSDVRGDDRHRRLVGLRGPHRRATASGAILRAEPRRMKPLMRRWAKDQDMWKRRSAILCQLGFKRETDLDLLYDCIEPNLTHKDFFIRKAIGWSLRQYAWTDPKEVRRYVKANRDRLSPLSVREAMKNM